MPERATTDLARAHATLRAGCAFLARHGEDGPQDATTLAQRAHSRMTGNRLRELDRFLSVLLDETALSLGRSGHDGKRFARLRNTPGKLRRVEAMMASATQDHMRLRAIGRLSACLHHCAGVIHAESLHDDVLLAQGGRDAGAALPHAPKNLRLSARTILEICAFYRAVGDRLLHGTLGAH
jgi:hypothetical protein